MSNAETMTPKALETLKKLISIPSFSREEENTANFIEALLLELGYTPMRIKNNVWATSKDYDDRRKTLMLNSHHDTVKPSAGWNTDPFTPTLDGDKLIGLGSNDAGAPLVSLLYAFVLSEQTNLNYNRVFLATAEEEVSGVNGMELALTTLPKIDAGIVGEPTQMEMAIAEKGLLVLDCEVQGKAGHAARTGGINAITEAMKEIEWFHTFQFPKASELLGPVKMTVTIINAGSQHNVIPDKCTFTVDVRTNEQYTNQQAFEIIAKHTKAQVKARSFRLNSSGIDAGHPLVVAAKELGVVCFGSPTTSDQALITTFPTIKMGPGDSNRSHTANEFIYTHELIAGIAKYLELMKALRW